MLGNRYELLEKIGGGGMATVYKAKCHFLNRFVAIKILRQEYTNDEEFVRRFKIEAQAAASLSHPNIVSIYDVGHEESTHYIVMEYIDGITLKEFLNRRGVLNWRDAIDISIQICSAIEHAHRNHIVHRDIKPHNILLTNDGIVKVTDFGIARAVSSSTITMAGSTIGSVHYFSPEQARGGYIDEKSDIYSLGITLYELVTGKLPFDGDSPVAVAIKHIQDEPESPININPEIPSGVNDIILKAIKKDQTKRYQSAGDMLQDLYRVIKEPNGAFVVSESMEGSPTRRLQAIGTPPPVRKEDFRIKEDKASNNSEKKKADKLTIIFAVVTAVIVIAISVYVGYSVVKPQLSSDKTSTEFEVKNYEGRNINEVLDELKQYGIKPEVKTETNKTVDKDIIIRQNPKEGVKLKPDGFGTLTLYVSSGPEQANMPPLSKIEIREAERKLDNLNIDYDIQYEFSDVAKDFVIRTDPAEGEKIEPGSTVTLYVSKGPEIKKTRVPNLLNMTESEAKKALANAGLKIGKIYPEGSNYTGKIVNQKPEATSEVDEDTPVDIYFSSSSATARTNVTKIITLDNPGNYAGDTVNIRVEATPSDTNVMEVLKNETVKKSDFPVRVSIPVPNGGKTDIKIFINNKDVLDDVLNDVP